MEGPSWEMAWDDDAFESLCVAAASLARTLLDGGAAVGLAAAGFSGTAQRMAFLPPRSGLAQLGRATDLLARLRTDQLRDPVRAPHLADPPRAIGRQPGRADRPSTARRPSHPTPAQRVGVRGRGAGPGRGRPAKRHASGRRANAGDDARTKLGDGGCGRSFRLNRSPSTTVRSGRPSAPPKPPRPSRLLPVVQCLAEGGLLAVIAAAVQALFGEVPTIGPFEFAILAGAGIGVGPPSPMARAHG